MLKSNLFSKPDETDGQEFVERLAGNDSVRVERIISTGQTSPPGFWYDQEESEWVSLLSGSATIEFENGETVSLESGDHLLIRPHQRHRVSFTDLNETTVWLAVFFQDTTS